MIVIALGSDHGDDSAAWRALRLATPELPPGTVARETRDPFDVVGPFPGCESLLVVDACRGAGPPGGLHKFFWPDPRLVGYAAVSGHGFGLAGALELAAAMGYLPPRVVVIAVEGAAGEPGAALHPAVAAAVPALAAAIIAERHGRWG